MPGLDKMALIIPSVIRIKNLRMNKIVYVFVLAVILSACANGQTKKAEANEITKLNAMEFQEKLKSTPNAVLIDVRTPQEFEKGHLIDALNLNWNGSEFASQLATLDKSEPVFVYCLSGARSGSAAVKMKSEGFTQVYVMPGGMMEWRSKSLPEIAKTASGPGMSMEEYTAKLESDKLVLVDIYADWCAPCKKMKPFLDKIAAEMPEKLVLVRIDADANPELMKKIEINSLPDLKLYKDKTLVWKHNGFMDEKTLREKI